MDTWPKGLITNRNYFNVHEIIWIRKENWDCKWNERNVQAFENYKNLSATLNEECLIEIV